MLLWDPVFYSPPPFSGPYMLQVNSWNEVLDWLQKFAIGCETVFTSVLKNVPHAEAVFIQNTSAGYADIKYKLYYKENDKWIEKTRTLRIKKDSLPSWAKEKISLDEVDISKEIEKDLKLKLNP